MPKVYHVKKARKSNRKLGIKKGKPYWWWKRRSPGSVQGYKVTSLTAPKPSQLVGSPFLQSIYSLQERLEEEANYIVDELSINDLADSLKEVARDLETIAEEQYEKMNNLPESLQTSPTAQLLEDRKEQCENLAGELEQAADELESIETADESEAVREAERIFSEISWEVG